MKKLFFAFYLLFFAAACTKTEVVSAPSDSGDGTYFHLKVNGTNIPYIKDGIYATRNEVSVYVKQTVISFNFNYGIEIPNSPGNNRLVIVFTKDGKFLEAHQNSVNIGEGQFAVYYKNYRYFPANYFNIRIYSIDEVQKRIKFTISGKLYFDDKDLNSESLDLLGDFDMKYNGDFGTIAPTFQVSGLDQHCTAKLNTAEWMAFRELENGSFTADDPYKIEINFPSTALVGTYNLITNSTNNYLRFSKFNTTTKVFDYYNLNGLISQTYREFHGGGNYSLFGTFSFTATNPNDPSDVIQVTDGDFRSYQHY